MKPFYYVSVVRNESPAVKHATPAEASVEAMRLAVEHPGISFEILKCIGTTQAIEPITFWLDGVLLDETI